MPLSGISTGCNYGLRRSRKATNHVEPPLFFWRDKEGREVDLILAEDGLLFPIEVKLSGTPNVRDIRGMNVLRRKGAPLGPGALVCMIDRPHPLSGDVEAVPPDAIW